MARRPAVVHVSSPLGWRGGEQQLVQLYEHLAREGVPQLVACAAGSELERVCRARDLRYLAHRRRTGLDPLFARGVAQAATALRADLVHAHDAHAHAAAVLAAALFRTPAAIVVHRRVDVPVGRSALTRWKYDHPDVRRILCVSSAVRDQLRPVVRDPSRLEVIHSGVDLARLGRARGDRLRAAHRIPARAPLVGNVAALAAHKDLPTFVDVAARLVAAGSAARFVLVGEGPERARLEALVRARRLERRVFLTGFRRDVPDLLPELDVLLFTSETEGLGTTILDAFASRVPVVATAAGGVPELVRHGESGLLARVKDAAALAGHVTRLLADRALRERLVEGGLARAALFPAAGTARRTLEVYEEILREREGRSRAG